MPEIPNFRSFRDPAFSLLQSAIHSTLLKHSAQGRTTLTGSHRGLGRTANHPYMVAANQVMKHFEANHDFNVAPAAAAAPAGGLTAHAAAGTGAAAAPSAVGGVVVTALECAKLVAEIAWDELFHRDKVPALKNELAFATCDPFWAECLVEYEKFIASDQPQPYVPYTDINQFVLPNCFPDTATIAVIGDWGTGMNDALVLLQQIKANFKPDVLLHLGDVYYSGLPSEDSANFTTLIKKSGRRPTPARNLR